MRPQSTTRTPRTGRPKTPLAERFWRFVDRTTTPGGCWPWTSAFDKDGYGIIWNRGGEERAHRVAYQLQVSPIPEGHGVLHHCDNPSCCRGAHLFTGTNADNMADAAAKGRRKGQRNGRAKLRDADVIKIRALYAASGISYDALAAAFGVSDTVIGLIIRRRNWAHLP